MKQPSYKFLGILVVGVLIGLLASTVQQPAQQPLTGPTQLSFKEQGNVGQVVPSEVAYAMRQEGQDIIIVDVREKEEWDEAHIPGAVWIPHSKLKENDNQTWAQLEMLSKMHKNVFTYCGAGHRSGFIASLAQKQGLNNTFNLDGFSFWKLKFPIIKGTTTPDKQAKPVHLDEAYYYYTSFNDVDFIDVREIESIQLTGGNIIKGARWVPLSELAKNLDKVNCDHDTVFVCEGTWDGGECSASPAAAKIAIERKGCKAGKMKYLIEGHGAWEAAGYPVEKLVP